MIETSRRSMERPTPPADTHAGRAGDEQGEGRAQPPLLALADPRSGDVALAGGKGASLARAAAVGLPVLPGFVVTTAAALPAARTGAVVPGAGLAQELRRAWGELSDEGERALVVRSSSPVEDGRVSSMAGMFTSVLDVRGWPAFLAALGRVLASATGPGGEALPMAVLVQPFLEPALGGVLFGADPVSGAADRLVVAAVEGGPDRLVSGGVDGFQLAMTPRGRLLEGGEGLPMGARQRRELARLAARTRQVFDGPQDMEWAIDGDGRLWLLQSRPITATGTAAEAGGPVLGPGPVAETFPEPLATLEEDLWAEPLRQALTEALVLVGTASRRRIAGSPVLVSVGGRVAVDLEIVGEAVTRRSLLSRLDPRPPARRLKASWRVGRLRAALPALGQDLVAEVDAQLLAVPELGELANRELLAVLQRARQVLLALHGHEILAGLLLPPEVSSVTGASMALRVLAEARDGGECCEDLVRSQPVVLALVPPAIGPTRPLPELAGSSPALAPAGDPLALVREALRLRARWVQELGARVAWELASRLARVGVLPSAEALRSLTLEELAAVVEHRQVPADLAERRAPEEPPLPAAFRLAPDGSVVPVQAGAHGTQARGAGGGRGSGRVHNGPGVPEEGAVLVVRTLDPGLAPLLPRLGGLVAETGSVLAHLAILAREYKVPTVVGVADAVERFRHDSVVTVDGVSGEVVLARGALSELSAGGGR